MLHLNKQTEKKGNKNRMFNQSLIKQGQDYVFVKPE